MQIMNLPNHYVHSQYICEIIILLLIFPLSYVYLSFNDIIKS